MKYKCDRCKRIFEEDDMAHISDPHKTEKIGGGECISCYQVMQHCPGCGCETTFDEQCAGNGDVPVFCSECHNNDDIDVELAYKVGEAHGWPPN